MISFTEDTYPLIITIVNSSKLIVIRKALTTSISAQTKKLPKKEILSRK